MTAAAFDLAARALCRMAQNGDTDKLPAHGGLPHFRERSEMLKCRW